LERQRFAVRNLPVFTDRVDKIGQSELSISERFPDAVFHQPSLKVNRLPGR
jgi:hypothetical protein